MGRAHQMNAPEARCCHDGPRADIEARPSRRNPSAMRRAGIIGPGRGAMTPAEAIAKLEVRKEFFVKQLGQPGRHWFTTRMVKHVEGASDLEGSASALLVKAKEAVASRLNK